MRRHSSVIPQPTDHQQTKEKPKPIRRISDAGYTKYMQPDDGAKYQWNIQQENSRPAFVVNNPTTWKQNNSPKLNAESRTKHTKPSQIHKAKTHNRQTNNIQQTQLATVQDEDQDEEVIEVIPKWKRKLFDQKQQAENLAAAT